MKVSTDKNKIEELLSRGVEEIIGRDHLKKRLESGDPLRVKLGIDPTSPNLHLGRSIPLLKLKDFQELGHQVVFIIGDFTGVIGDTSDKDSERPMLSPGKIKENMKSYVEQAGKILDMKKCEVHYNSEWLEKLGLQDFAWYTNSFSLAEFISRDNIRRRLDSGKRVSLRELLYPIFQGYDSVKVKADVEIGGTDQRFNLLAGRTMQDTYQSLEQHGDYDDEPQDIIMNPLVAGTDGRKMSSSWGNTVDLTDEPDDMFGKIMSIPDDLIISYFTYMTRVPMEDIEKYTKEMKKGGNPRDYKILLAKAIVTFYHSQEEAVKAEENFVNTFAKKQTPDEMPELKPSKPDIITVLIEAGFAKTNSEARRAIDGGGVKVNDEKIEGYEVEVGSGDIVQKGKRFFVRIV